MSQESQARNFFIVFFLIFAIPFTIVIIKIEKRIQRIYDKAVEIRQWDSLGLKATDIWRNRTDLFFNDSLYIFL